MLPEERAAEISEAAARVARHYDIAILDPKYQDMAALALLLGKTWIPMGAAVYARHKMGPQGQAAQPMNGMAEQAQPEPINGVHGHVVMPGPMTGAVN